MDHRTGFSTGVLPSMESHTVVLDWGIEIIGSTRILSHFTLVGGKGLRTLGLSGSLLE